MTTKIHAVVDGLGNLIRLRLTGGNMHDSVPACGLITGLHANKTIAYKAYDSDRFIHLACDKYLEQGIPRQAFLCGPPLMIEAVTRVLEEKGIHPDDIFYDEF